MNRNVVNLIQAAVLVTVGALLVPAHSGQLQ